ncbi:DUF475 domain-containing protein [Candidatus Saccharibacteria bacterium]|nr:DUF475 domain-containing protein [Candidatus Saccharibacteria bacterium]
MTKEQIKIFWFSAFSTLAVAGAVWYYMGPAAALTAALLIVLEITFSFENAVINAKMLDRLSHVWQQIFMTIGIAIAVFGMRIVFPLVLVAITGQLAVGDVLDMALNDSEAYAHQLEESMPAIAAFGSAFLLMVFFYYFTHENDGKPWLRPFEATIRRLPRHWLTHTLIVAVLVVGANFLLARERFGELALAGAIGIATHLVIHGLIVFLESRKMAHSAGKMVGWAGFAGFMYLEVLDASFSLDGVIGAFAITNNVILIAAGLGAGAVWVRSMTVYLVRHKTLSKYVFLEQGAHYAIGLLALVLLVHTSIHVPEVFTGLAGVAIIVASIIASVRFSKTNAKHKAKTVRA